MSVPFGICLLVLNTTMLIVSAFVTSIQSSIIMKAIINEKK
jgi:hypothetical protein